MRPLIIIITERCGPAPSIDGTKTQTHAHTHTQSCSTCFWLPHDEGASPSMRAWDALTFFRYPVEVLWYYTLLLNLFTMHSIMPFSLSSLMMSLSSNIIYQEVSLLCTSRCCHSSAWADAVLARMPFESEEEARAALDDCWAKLTPAGTLSGRPVLHKHATGACSSGEQQGKTSGEQVT